jgi:BON domain
MTTAAFARTDQEIQTDVLTELRWDLGTPAKDIGVAVKDGVVTLTGTVDTYLNKWKAEQAAHRVIGVAAVANDTTVRTIGERTDSDIAVAAVHALKWNTGVPADKIHVTNRQRRSGVAIPETGSGARDTAALGCQGCK